MKAVVWTKYGSPDGLQLQEVEKPTPKDHEVLIRVYASSVTAGDSEARGLRFPFWLALPMRLFMGPIKPRNIILGQELAGEIEAVGQAVTRFKVGDQIFGATGFRFGGYAEYNCLPEESDDGVLALKPANMTYEEAAAVPTGGLEALHFLRIGRIQRGEKLLIIGAGGSIGTFAIQIARYFGAEVTAVDSGGKLDLLRSLGADRVMDYTQEDFAKSGETYDAVFDVVGKNTFSRSLKSLRPGGRYLLANPSLSAMLQRFWISRTSRKKVILEPAKRTPEDLEFLKELIEAGKLKSVIDRRFPLEQTAEAHRYVDTGQKKGNVVITVAQQP
ncbi:MAG: NAD(P)-dependent alcohol dehydrogenase [Anaerolineae bacterium]|nr:NAD(P)-dependent alcohol dehydrogenase [Anaerolineae bacterium]